MQKRLEVGQIVNTFGIKGMVSKDHLLKCSSYASG